MAWRVEGVAHGRPPAVTAPLSPARSLARATDPPCRNKLLHAAGVNESFPLHDLIKPDPARLRRYLSAMINYQKYREEKIAYYADLEARSVRG